MAMYGLLGSGGGREGDADELLAVRRRRVREALRGDGGVSSGGDGGGGVEKHKVSAMWWRLRRRRVGVLDVTGVHEDKSLKAISTTTLDF